MRHRECDRGNVVAPELTSDPIAPNFRSLAAQVLRHRAKWKQFYVVDGHEQADYALSISGVGGGPDWVVARLSRKNDGEVIWTERFDDHSEKKKAVSMAYGAARAFELARSHRLVAFVPIYPLLASARTALRTRNRRGAYLARRMFAQAMEIVPQIAVALSGYAALIANPAMPGRIDGWRPRVGKALSAVKRVIELEPAEGASLRSMLNVGEHERGLAEAKRGCGAEFL